ncbi:NAD(P)-dependent oxidoreductase [uncultured Sphingomonas sp.]|uniref:NAD(P)-dependent oxidoreductase n=1 Tax=uncultured Sphingomonas sp. TaxID=158754 RepID=UPI0025DA4431|nr:NAD(P)-dependent oxidoreductase [uncultured Sphingomonas sp.]
MRIGFVGLGRMGEGIARNLLKAGHDVLVWNRSADKADTLVADGATRAATPAEAARAEVIHTMLADDHAVAAVTFGPDGILSADPGIIHVSHSTISVKLAEGLTQAHRDHGGGFVSAPVFGRPAAAADAKLFIVAGGGAEALAKVRPLLDAIGQRTFEIGAEPSQANLVKLSGNFMIMSVIESLAEAMALAQRGGVDKATLLEVLTGTLFGAPIYNTYGGLLIGGEFRPAGFVAPLGLKDMNLVAEAAGTSGVPMPLLSLVRDRLTATIQREGADIDWSGIAKVVWADAGL